MSDPLRKVRPGDDLVIPAAAYNAFVDAARAHREADRAGGAGRPEGRYRRGDVVRVVNDSGLDLPRGSVLGVDGPAFAPGDDEPAFLREVVLRGVVPTAGHARRFVVTLDPIPAGAVGRAHAAGACPALIDVVDPAHTHALADPGETGALVSSDSGPAEILWRDGDDAYYGAAWAIVLIGSFCADDEAYYA